MLNVGFYTPEEYLPLFIAAVALCPEEAESALDATNFFADDVPRGTNITNATKFFRNPTVLHLLQLLHEDLINYLIHSFTSFSSFLTLLSRSFPPVRPGL